MAEAIDLYEQVITDARRVFGDDHPTTQIIAENLERARDDRDDSPAS